MLEDYGFELRRTKGSHNSFVGYIGEEKVTVVIPFPRPLQQVYVEKVLAILDEIEPLESGESEESTHDDE